MMVAFESLVSHWLYKRETETNLIAKLGKAVVWVLSAYIIVKLVDLILSGKISMIFEGTWESYLFMTEILISTIIPLIIFAVPRLRSNIKAQWIGSFMVIIGMVFNRLNVGGLTMLSATGDSYTPSWMEISISLGVVSVAALIFLFVIEHFHVWDVQPVNPESLPHSAPSFDYSSNTWLGTPDIASLTKYSLAFVISFAVGMALMPGSQIKGKGIEDIKVSRASGKDILVINGNRDNYIVAFPHKEHINRIGEDQCKKCHHLTLPLYQENSCWECHTNMYEDVDFFKHDWHSMKNGANIKCNDCHTPGLNRSAETAKKCVDCHPQYQLTVYKKNNFKNYYTYSYTDAMHKLCVSCHKLKAEELVDKPNLAQCSTCHATEFPQKLEEKIKWEITMPHFNHVVLPEVSADLDGEN